MSTVNNGALPSTDPEQAARTVRRMFKKVAQEIDVEKHGLSGVLSAIQKVLGIQEGHLTADDQACLVEFLGAEATSQFLLLSEDTPSISASRARVLTNWFDMFMRAVRGDAEPEVIWRLGKKLGLEYINALADRTLRS